MMAVPDSDRGRWARIGPARGLVWCVRVPAQAQGCPQDRIRAGGRAGGQRSGSVPGNARESTGYARDRRGPPFTLSPEPAGSEQVRCRQFFPLVQTVQRGSAGLRVGTAAHEGRRGPNPTLFHGPPGTGTPTSGQFSRWGPAPAARERSGTRHPHPPLTAEAARSAGLWPASTAERRSKPHHSTCRHNIPAGNADSVDCARERPPPVPRAKGPRNGVDCGGGPVFPTPGPGSRTRPRGRVPGRRA